MIKHRSFTQGIHPGWLVFVLSLGLWTGNAPSAFAQCETRKLLANDGESGDLFGNSLSIDGDLLVISAAGGNGGRGAVYVYRRDPVSSTWVHEAKLVASDSFGAGFGQSVSVSGNVIVVGAPLDFALGPTSGSAYVFRYDPVNSKWTPETKLLAFDYYGSASNDRFGQSVSLSGNVLAVGAWLSTNEAGDYTGAANVFRYDGSSWVQETRLFPPDDGNGDWFGENLSLCDDVLLIGAAGHSAFGQRVGAAYVYRHDTESLTWILEAKLMASDGADLDYFGFRLDLHDDVALIGSPFKDDPGENSGSAYVFRFDEITSTWLEEAKLLPSDGATRDVFATDLVLRDDVAYVCTLNGDGIFSDSGSVYRFRFDGANWTEEIELFPSYDGDHFGSSIVERAGEILVGALADDDQGRSSGSVFVFATDNETCCPTDTDASGEVNVFDLLDLLQAWGSCPAPCPPDTNRDGRVNVEDLLRLLSTWGECPSII
ncbi:MAG: FG-GAP repeat protein [Planctomycetota bacterium]|nr:FG-GAP repeat protein [Planctomycetota bacterium]